MARFIADVHAVLTQQSQLCIPLRIRGGDHAPITGGNDFARM